MPARPPALQLTSCCLGAAAMCVNADERGVHLPATYPHIDAVEGNQVGVRGRPEHRLLRQQRRAHTVGSECCERITLVVGL